MKLNLSLYRELRAEGYAPSAAVFYARRSYRVNQWREVCMPVPGAPDASELDEFDETVDSSNVCWC
jgi:hypothetical protein